MGQQTSPNGLSFVLVLVVCSLLPSQHVQGKPNLLRNLGDEDIVQESHPSALTTGFRCMVCHWGAALMVDYERAGRSKEEFLSVTARLCSLFGIQGKDICHGMVHNVGEQMFHILQKGNGTIHAWDICALVEEGQCTGHSKRINDWSLKIPDLNRPQQALVPRYPTKPVKIQKILHLSDPHVQRDYQIGANAECGEPVCCARINGYPSNKKLAADKLGDYRCDLPPWTLDAFMKEIRQRHLDIDYIFVTGDYPAHDVWRQNRTGNLESTKVVVNVIKKHFPSIQGGTDIPVFPTIGNHEAFPVNMFPDINETGRYNPGWLYANLAKFYKDWLPSKIQQKTIKRGGYYSTQIRPGLKLISVNTNVCNNFNFWLLLDFNDPIGHLHWIYKELHKAELNKEKVFIIGHIPPGTKSCYNQWAQEYGRIVHRFNNTILGQFFGHTHFDEFEVFHQGHIPISIGYLAPSLTPGGGLNPAYRIYEIDGDHANSTNLILDHSTSYFDLQASIQASTLVHVKEYSAKKDFNLPDLSPQSWRSLVFKMAADEVLFKKFLAYFFRFGPALANPCGVSCQKEILCQLSTGASGDQSICLQLEELVDQRSNSIWNWIWS